MFAISTDNTMFDRSEIFNFGEAVLVYFALFSFITNNYELSLIAVSKIESCGNVLSSNNQSRNSE